MLFDEALQSRTIVQEYIACAIMTETAEIEAIEEP